METRSLVTIAKHSKEKLLYLIEMAQEFEKHPNRKILDGKIVATLFFEPNIINLLLFFYLPIEDLFLKFINCIT